MTSRVLLALSASALLLAACSSSGSSLLGASKPKTTTEDLVAAPVTDPKTRAVQVAWNVSRAAKCNFNLDAPTVKANYLAYETGQGLAPTAVPELEKAYEFARIETATRIAGQEGTYCTDQRLNETRADLARYLAGDFAARQIAKKKTLPEPGLFDAFDTGVRLPQKTTEEALAPKE